MLYHFWHSSATTKVTIIVSGIRGITVFISCPSKGSPQPRARSPWLDLPDFDSGMITKSPPVFSDKIFYDLISLNPLNGTRDSTFAAPLSGWLVWSVNISKGLQEPVLKAFRAKTLQDQQETYHHELKPYYRKLLCWRNGQIYWGLPGLCLHETLSQGQLFLPPLSFGELLTNLLPRVFTGEQFSDFKRQSGPYHDP